MNLLQPIQILQTGMKFLFDLDPTITEQLYLHSLSQAALITAVGARLGKTLINRIQEQSKSGADRFRALTVSR